MSREELVAIIRQKKSCLCVGLDTDIDKIPSHFFGYPNPVLEFNKQIVEVTQEHCVAYKINTAFYESRGALGWETMRQTVDIIPDTHFTIADAKRGDIGNTSAQYAKAFFETIPFDAVTVAPYMGSDSVKPFLQYENRWAVVLGLTSNPGSADFEMLPLKGKSTEYLYQKVLRTVAQWGSPNNLMFVIGATQKEQFGEVRRLLPNHFLLVPGVGAQGGKVSDIMEQAMNEEVGLLINVSRDILFAGSAEGFAEAAGRSAKKYHMEMQKYIA